MFVLVAACLFPRPWKHACSQRTGMVALVVVDRDVKSWDHCCCQPLRRVGCLCLGWRWVPLNIRSLRKFRAGQPTRAYTQKPAPAAARRQQPTSHCAAYTRWPLKRSAARAAQYLSRARPPWPGPCRRYQRTRATELSSWERRSKRARPGLLASPEPGQRNRAYARSRTRESQPITLVGLREGVRAVALPRLSRHV
jgi:hypothetical protein